MLIIGCDFHTRYQQIAMAREETSELLPGATGSLWEPGSKGSSLPYPTNSAR